MREETKEPRVRREVMSCWTVLCLLEGGELDFCWYCCLLVYPNWLEKASMV